jgi:ribosomal protein L29
MKASELISLSDSELADKLKTLKTSLLDLRLSIPYNSEKDTSKVRKLKKETARIYTILNERKKS